MAHAGFPNGLQTDKEWLSNELIKQNNEPLCKHQRLVIEKYNQEPIGEMSFREKESTVFEIGIKICNFKEHSKGYGERAIRLLIAFLKEEMKGTKIILDTNLTNTGAQRFYKRLGFTQTEIRYDCWTDQLGKLQSAILFEMEL